MRIGGEEILSNLKSKTIMDRKPNLKICSNHQQDKWPRVIRFWDQREGTAKRDDKGWYVAG